MRSLAVVVLCSFVTVACDTRPPLAGFDVGPRPDASRQDAGSDAARDAPADDRDLDAFGDANANDSGFQPGSCRFVMADDLIEIDTDPRLHPTRVAVSAGPTGFGIVYSKLGSDAFENIYFTEIASTVGGLRPMQQLTFDLANTITPAIARTDLGWILAWASNHDGTMEIYSLGSGADGRLGSSVHRLTMDAVQQQAPALASARATTAIAWTELDATGHNPTTVVQALAAAGTTTGTVQRIMPAGFTVRPQTFTTTDFGYVMGWSDPSLQDLVLSLDNTGAASGTPTALTTVPDADATFDAVVSGGGGAAVFGVDVGGRREVHAHLLDAAGGALDVERVLTVGAAAGSDASIAELGGGYIVAYRQTGTPPTLRVLFLDSLLNEVTRLDLLSVSTTGGQTSTRISGDGVVLITWADVVGTETHLRAARIRCN